MQQDLECWLRFAGLPGFGVKAASEILEQCEISTLIDLDDLGLAQLGFKPNQIKAFQNPDRTIIDRCLTWSEKKNRHIITLIDPYYPYLLKQIPAPPTLLFVEGDPLLLCSPQVAIVGSRNASQDGLAQAKAFSFELALRGLTVTSGLALGIDGRAHRGALDAKGKTIAVLGSGLERIYPAPHQALAAEIIHNGALISEFWPWLPPKAAFFPKRNRIISGLSIGVLVIEAALRSGSLITARLALEQGRDVFALPGSIHNPQAKGSNGLIKQGAFLVESVEDIVEQTGVLADCAIKNQLDILHPQVLEEKLPFPKLLANVGDEARCVDVLAERCDQPVHEITIQLLELELQGIVSAVPGGYVRTRRG